MASTHFREVTVGGVTHLAMVVLPRLWKRDQSRSAVLLLPGTADLVQCGVDPTLAQGTVAQIVAKGFPVCVFMSTNTYGATSNLWGNAASRVWVSAMKALMESEYGTKPGKVFLVGLSQGALNALSYAGEYPENVSGIHTFIPATSLLQAKNDSWVSAAVNAAYGGNYSDTTHGPNYSPIQMALTYSFPMPIVLCWAGKSNGDTSTDGTLAYSDISTFHDRVNARGGDARLVHAGNTGHSWAAAMTTAAKQSLDDLLDEVL